VKREDYQYWTRCASKGLSVWGGCGEEIQKMTKTQPSPSIRNSKNSSIHNNHDLTSPPKHHQDHNLPLDRHHLHLPKSLLQIDPFPTQISNILPVAPSPRNLSSPTAATSTSGQPTPHKTPSQQAQPAHSNGSSPPAKTDATSSTAPPWKTAPSNTNSSKHAFPPVRRPNAPKPA
jgi:hypothetical protein